MYKGRIKGDTLLYAFALSFLRCLIKITPAPIAAKINNDHASPRGYSVPPVPGFSVSGVPNPFFRLLIPISVLLGLEPLGVSLENGVYTVDWYIAAEGPWYCSACTWVPCRYGEVEWKCCAKTALEVKKSKNRSAYLTACELITNVLSVEFLMITTLKGIDLLLIQN